MNEAWKSILKKWIQVNNAIYILECKIIEKEDADKLKLLLLEEIIETVKSEVEE